MINQSLSKIGVLLRFVLALGISFLMFSCDKEELPEVPTCTFSKDPECFCRENPNNPLCNVANCTFELDQECFCTNAPDDPRCKTPCVFEEDPDCFCEENPNDEKCMNDDVGGGESSGFYTFFDFEDNPEIDSIFSTGFTGDNPDGWQSDGRAVASLSTDGAIQGNQYFVAEIEVLNENWAWTSNLYKAEAIDISSLSNPTLNFWARTSNEKPMTIEIALADDTGESGFHPGGAYAEINGDWKQISIKLNDLNNIPDWKWGDGINFSTINFFKFGFNINGQAAGDIFEVHIDDIYINDGVPNGAIAYPKVEVVDNKVCTLFDFEDEAEIETFFSTGFTGDNPDGWQDAGRAVASIATGDAAEGDAYFVNELEVLSEGWAWTSNLFKEELIDLSALNTPTLNFWARTSHEKPLVMEFAMSDGTGESGWHPGAPYAEINGDWQQFSIDLAALNAEGWKWGDGIDFDMISFFKLGFNIDGQAAGDIFEVHIDHVYLSDGVPNGAIAYPKAAVVDPPAGESIDLNNFQFPEGSFVVTDFEGAAGEDLLSSFDILASENVDAFAELASGGVAGSQYASFEITELDASQAYWSDFDFQDVNASFAAEDSVYLNFVVKYNAEGDVAMGMHPIIYDANHTGLPEFLIEEGGDMTGVNKFAKFFNIPSGGADEWRIISINLTAINALGWGKWNVQVTPDACCPDLTLIQHLQFALNLNPWINEAGTTGTFGIDAIWLHNSAPTNATVISPS